MSTVLEDILACPDLPSLPAVAVQVIDLTGDPNVSMDDLAAVIQNDQALAAKVLRTINSSFYGLREKCTTIRKAIVMLGLSPVKSLTLGFSLVSSIDMEKEPNFDFQSYWRRGLVTAVGGRIVAAKASPLVADEAFLAGLLQDFGMFAMYKALDDDYLLLLDRIGGDHSSLAKEELSAFDLQHPEIGAMLAERWRLPASLVIPIRYHERPTAAPKEALEIVRAMAMGGLANEILSNEDPGPPTRKFYQRGEQWFKLSSDDCQALLKEISAGATEMSKLLELDAGDFKNAESKLEEADRRIVELGASEKRESFANSNLEKILHETPDIDAVTGLPSKQGFEPVLKKFFETTTEAGDDLTLVQLTIEGLAGVTNSGGQMVSDEVLLSVIALVNRRFEPMGGFVCRIANAVLSVVIPACGLSSATGAANAVRDDVRRLSPAWLSQHSITDAKLGVCIGVASVTDANRAEFDSPQKLLIAATRALQTDRANAAGDAGGADESTRAAA